MRHFDAFLCESVKNLEKILTVTEAKNIDKQMIEKYEVPSMVLIENASKSVSQYISTNYSLKTKLLVFAGFGNNGADAICIARILWNQGYDVAIYLTENDHERTIENCMQQRIALHFGVPFLKNFLMDKYDLIIDGIYGIGCNRVVVGDELKCIRAMNSKDIFVISLDIPSGLHGDFGHPLGIAVKASKTFTFGFVKSGLLLGKAKEYTGDLETLDVGYDRKLVERNAHTYETYSKKQQIKLPERMNCGNKGSFGKIIIFAGSEQYGGAAILSSLAAYRTGSGMVRVITHSVNRDLLLSKVPEALITCYDQLDSFDDLNEIFQWATVLVAGPGIGKRNEAKDILHRMLIHSYKHIKIPLLLDADALQMISRDKSLQDIVMSSQNESIIFTPHSKEFSGLLNYDLEELENNQIQIVDEFASKMNIILVWKDATTIISCHGRHPVYVNQTGNHSLAVAGSGDVLTGIIASIIGQGIPAYHACVLGVHIHGQISDELYIEYGASLLPSDIIDAIKLKLK